jgi:hypothetical protein
MSHRLLPLEALSRGLPLDLVDTKVGHERGGAVRIDWSGGVRNLPLALYRFCNCRHCVDLRYFVPMRGIRGPWDGWDASQFRYVAASDNEGCGFTIIFTEARDAKWLVLRYLQVTKLPIVKPRCSARGDHWNGRSFSTFSYERGKVAQVTLAESLAKVLSERGVWK